VSIRGAKIVPDLRVYAARNVSKERGRKCLRELEERGLIAPERTPTGRTLLSFPDAERLAESL